MLRSHINKTNHLNKRQTLKNPTGPNFFHFELSEKNHEIVLPAEMETPWEQMHDIICDPGRGD